MYKKQSTQKSLKEFNEWERQVNAKLDIEIGQKYGAIAMRLVQWARAVYCRYM